MIFGNKKIFAVECEKSGTFSGTKIVQACLYINNQKIGVFEETAISGTILLAIASFLKFSNLRCSEENTDHTAFDMIYKSMYGRDWRIGIEKNYRDKYSIHDIFEIAVADQGYVVYLTTFSQENSRILIGSREGKYFGSVDVCEKYVNHMFLKIFDWIEEEE
ncbi:hypothetical protein [Diaphorobacter aerolatus]|uniref:Uncharacterized protein n=1 Tax=Diaphorobacter aerolatus TaxID=1288495 RepID=A0A7H0GKU4_9BURK|nr:hypothetical protein [Diaphorobacter aerolatus]QNP48910.1 hypothetical protein H9K75_01525 [Diaphorobacter aerolatus]